MKQLLSFTLLMMLMTACANSIRDVTAQNSTVESGIVDTEPTELPTSQSTPPISPTAQSSIADTEPTEAPASPPTLPINSISDENQLSSVEILGGDEAALREFVTRWFTPPPYAETGRVVISIGRLQDELPVDLPMPDDAQIVASVTGQWADYMILINTSLTPDEVQEFYAQELLDRGWQPPVDDAVGKGFVSMFVPNSYCFDDGHTYLGVDVQLAASGVTDLRLSLYVDANTQMCLGGTMGYTPEHFNLIPSLEAPEGIVLGDSGTGGSDSTAESRSQLETTLTAVDLVDHYNPQLTEAGWELLTQGDGNGAAWSTWAVMDDDGQLWNGMLFIVESSDNGRFAYVRIERAS